MQPLPESKPKLPSMAWLHTLRDLVLTTAIVLAGIFGMVWGIHYVLSALSLVLWPVIVAGMMSLLVEPAVSFFQGLLGGNRKLAVNIFFFVLMVALVGIFFYLGPLLWEQAKAFLEFVPVLFQKAKSFMVQSWPQSAVFWQQESWLEGDWKGALSSAWEAFQPTAVSALKVAGTTVLGVALMLVAWAILPVYLFYFLLAVRPQREPWHRHLAFLTPRWRQPVIFLTEQFIDILINFFRGQFVIAGIMAIVLSIGLTAVGLKFGFLIGVLMGLLNVIPYVGSLVGLMVALPIAFFQPDGGWAQLGWVVGLLALSSIFESYFLSPKVMGKRTGLHPAAILFSLFFWSTLIPGPLGLILAVPLSAFWVVIWRLIFQKITQRSQF
jgi:predicted PurR-regulated permease PerM